MSKFQLSALTPAAQVAVCRVTDTDVCRWRCRGHPEQGLIAEHRAVPAEAELQGRILFQIVTPRRPRTAA